ncbi:MAG: UbiA family prenyltransferase, partial [Pirellulaceae bacterium]|nr:UbiA family prenyltransferase [Pirellulaceae bacterium]
MSTLVLAFRRRVAWLAWASDYVELTKPKISVMILVTVAMAAYVAGAGRPDLWLLMHALLGTLLVSASASALNQWLERDSDSRMPRTADRPLPAGRLGGGQVLAFALVTLLAGTTELLLLVGLTATLLALATWLLYAWVYTPLKSRTWLNTAVGAVA